MSKEKEKVARSVRPYASWRTMDHYDFTLKLFFFLRGNGSSVYVSISQANFKQMGACEKTEHFSMIVQQVTKLKAWEFLVLYEWI